MNDALRALLHPQSIAVIGASTDFNKINGRTFKALVDKGYAGRILPVNPKYQTLLDRPCYPDVASIPGTVDLAVVAVPARHVPETLRELGRKGVKVAVVFSSGFSEVGGDGVQLEAELRQAIRDSGVRVLGPNCLGLVNVFENMMATFSQFSLGPTPEGPAAFVTQSGALGTATAGVARKRGLNFGFFVNTGNETDLQFVDVMGAIVAEDKVTVGAGYIEGLKNGPGLLRVAEDALARGKPLVLTKVGRTRAGAKAIASHTGSLAGEDAVFAGVIRQRGIIRARSDEQLLDFVEVFSQCALPGGRGIGIITRSGGAGALMADRAEEIGLDVATLSEATTAALRKVVPAFGSTGNPVDITAQGLVDPNLMRESIKILLSDPKVDVAIAWLSFSEKQADLNVRNFVEAKAQASKPFIVCWMGMPEAAGEQMRAAGIPVLRSAEAAVDAIGALVQYAEARRQWQADAPARAALQLPALKLPAQPGPVSSLEGQALLQGCGVQTAAAKLAGSADAAVAAAEALGYPVVLKIESPDILHKTEAKGVALNLKDAAAVRAAHARLIANARAYKSDARISGVLVQAMAQGTTELVIGLQRDPTFGPVVMVGLGGVLIEVFKDVVFRAAPVTEAEALRMLDELKSRAVLDGVRGAAPVDRTAVARMVSAVSRLGAAAGPRLRELDLNPVLAGPQGATAVDWLMVLD
ncbi:MAG: acetate--CoA ligase family protein [Betaproteobacteria bacterium]|jgi:acetyltransferase|nr:acetate--CoA ligase family protein [Betaproteobacteria bacterium]